MTRALQGIELLLCALLAADGSYTRPFCINALFLLTLFSSYIFLLNFHASEVYCKMIRFIFVRLAPICIFVLGFYLMAAAHVTPLMSVWTSRKPTFLGYIWIQFVFQIVIPFVTLPLMALTTYNWISWALVLFSVLLCERQLSLASELPSGVSKAEPWPSTLAALLLASLGLMRSLWPREAAEKQPAEPPKENSKLAVHTWIDSRCTHDSLEDDLSLSSMSCFDPPQIVFSASQSTLLSEDCRRSFAASRSPFNSIHESAFPLRKEVIDTTQSAPSLTILHNFFCPASSSPESLDVKIDDSMLPGTVFLRRSPTPHRFLSPRVVTNVRSSLRSTKEPPTILPIDDGFLPQRLKSEEFTCESEDCRPAVLADDTPHNDACIDPFFDVLTCFAVLTCYLLPGWSDWWTLQASFCYTPVSLALLALLTKTNGSWTKDSRWCRAIATERLPLLIYIAHFPVKRLVHKSHQAVEFLLRDD